MSIADSKKKKKSPALLYEMWRVNGIFVQLLRSHLPLLSSIIPYIYIHKTVYYNALKKLYICQQLSRGVKPFVDKVISRKKNNTAKPVA